MSQLFNDFGSLLDDHLIKKAPGPLLSPQPQREMILFVGIANPTSKLYIV